jgi:hypothetical protein
VRIMAGRRREGVLRSHFAAQLRRRRGVISTLRNGRCAAAGRS